MGRAGEGGKASSGKFGSGEGIYSDELLKRYPITDPGSNANINACFKLLSRYEWFSVSDQNPLIWHFIYLHRQGSPSMGLFNVACFSV